jgi:hypothetical protein
MWPRRLINASFIPEECNNKNRSIYCDATASSLVAKVRGEVFSHFGEVAVTRQSSIRNWLFGLPGRILCERSPWCRSKLWACSWPCSSPFSPFWVSLSLHFPCKAHPFFPERLSNHYEALRRTFPEILNKTWRCSFVGSIAISPQAK